MGGRPRRQLSQGSAGGPGYPGGWRRLCWVCAHKDRHGEGPEGGTRAFGPSRREAPRLLTPQRSALWFTEHLLAQRWAQDRWSRLGTRLVGKQTRVQPGGNCAAEPAQGWQGRRRRDCSLVRGGLPGLRQAEGGAGRGFRQGQSPQPPDLGPPGPDLSRRDLWSVGGLRAALLLSRPCPPRGLSQVCCPLLAGPQHPVLETREGPQCRLPREPQNIVTPGEQT